MTRWFSKRWAWAAVVGATVTVALAAGGADAPPQKVGTTISLNIDGKGERQFKVLKCEKQPDGTYHSELKDTKTGDVITLVDQPDAPPAKGAEPPKGADPVKPPVPTKAPEPAKGPDTAPPKAKPRTTDPLLPPLAATMPDPAKDKEKEKDKRPVLGRVFGDKDKTPEPVAAAEPAKKPGLFSRVFGSKKPSGPAMPAATVPTNVKPTSPTPPPVIPTPPGGLHSGSTTAEPPRVMPAKPATPVTAPPVATAPNFPAPLPTPAPAVPNTIPAPLPVPAPPVTTAPPPPAPVPVPSAIPSPVPAPAPIPVPLPAPPAGGGLPPIPIPPGGTSSVKPLQVVVPAGYVPAQVAFDRDVEPFVIALQSMSAPSARLTAAKGLAEGRHGSTDGVKAVLFKAAQMDPCGEVRAACIAHLCKLGYFDAQFLGHLQAACGDPDPQVSAAAKAACAKMLKQ